MKIITIIVLSLLMLTAIGCIDKEPLVYTNPDVVIIGVGDVTDIYSGFDYEDLGYGWYDVSNPQAEIIDGKIERGFYRVLYVTNKTEEMILYGIGYKTGNAEESSFETSSNGEMRIYEVTIFVDKLQSSDSWFAMSNRDTSNSLLFVRE